MSRPPAEFAISASAHPTPTVSPRDYFALSEREDQVLACMWKGLSDSEIAYQFDISPATVRAYKKRLQLKVGARRPSEILCCAISGLPHVAVSHQARPQY